MTIRTGLATATALVAVLALPAIAAAKGPAEARIAGPGLIAPITIGGDPLGDLGLLVGQTGFFPQTFGQSPDPLLREQPGVRRLGPRYTVTYTVPGGPTGSSTVAQEIYPYAAGSVISYMKPGQTIWEQKTHGGWYRGGALSVELREMLVRAGLPQAPPSALRTPNRSRITEARIALQRG